MLYNGIYVERDIEKGLRLFKSIADDWKVEEMIANTYAFKMLIEDYKDIDVQYLFGLLDFYRGKYKEDREYIKKAKEIFEKLVNENEHLGAKEKLEEIRKIEEK